MLVGERQQEHHAAIGLLQQAGTVIGPGAAQHDVAALYQPQRGAAAAGLHLLQQATGPWASRIGDGARGHMLLAIGGFQHGQPTALHRAQLDAAAAHMYLCATPGSIQGIEQYQTRVIDLRVGVAEGLPQIRGEPGVERITLNVQGARGGKCRAAWAQVVVQPQSHAQHPAWAQVRFPRQHETQRADQVRCLPAYHFAFTQCLAHQSELALFQVAQATVDQLAAGAGGMSSEVVLLAQQHAQAAAAGITGDSGTVDTATDHQQVDVVHRASASCVCRVDCQSTALAKVEQARLYRTRVTETTTGPEGPVALHQ